MKEWLRSMNKTDVRNYLAVTTTVGVLVILIMLVFYPIPKSNVELLYMGIGFFMGQGFGGVMGYYFSANKSNKNLSDEKEPN